RRKGAHPELGAVALRSPVAFVFWPVVHQEHHASRREPFDEAVEDRLAFSIGPVEILEHENQRLHLALAQQHTPDRVERLLPSLRRIDLTPARVLDRHVEERQESRNGRRQRLIEREDLSRDLLSDASRIVALLDLEVGSQQLYDRKVRGRLAPRDTRRLQREPSLREVGPGQLPEESRLADA